MAVFMWASINYIDFRWPAGSAFYFESVEISSLIFVLWIRGGSLVYFFCRFRLV